MFEEKTCVNILGREYFYYHGKLYNYDTLEIISHEDLAKIIMIMRDEVLESEC